MMMTRLDIAKKAIETPPGPEREKWLTLLPPWAQKVVMEVILRRQVSR
jgi:hypothetical protein